MEIVKLNPIGLIMVFGCFLIAHIILGYLRKIKMKEYEKNKSEDLRKMVKGLDLTFRFFPMFVVIILLIYFYS